MKNRNIPSRTKEARRNERKRRVIALMSMGKCVRCSSIKRDRDMKLCDSCAKKYREYSRKKQGFSNKIERPQIYR